MQKMGRVASTVAVIALFVAACGGGTTPTSVPSVAAPTSPAATDAQSEAPASEAPPAGAAVSVEVADSDLGQILVDAEGRTLYGFTPDAEGEPTCYDDCAEAWPPLVTDGEVTAGEGASQELLSTVERTDGTMQVKIGDWPLYYFAGDEAAGDTNGQGLNDVWWVVDPNGELIETPASSGEPSGGTGSALVNVAESDLGTILVDAQGMTLYGFIPDSEGEPTCYDQCAENWPPVLVEGELTVGEGLSEDVFATADRTDGTTQLKAGDWPLYYFAGDEAAGDTNGQGVNDVWFVVDGNGELVGAPGSSDAGIEY